MFKNKSFNVKMIDDPNSFPKWTQPKEPIDWDKVSEQAWVHTRNVALCIGGIVVAKNLSYTLGGAVRDITWRIIDVKYPYPK